MAMFAETVGGDADDAAAPLPSCSARRTQPFSCCCRGQAVERRRHLRLPVNLGVSIGPEKKALVLERFGKYLKMLSSWIRLLAPGVDRMP